MTSPESPDQAPPPHPQQPYPYAHPVPPYGYRPPPPRARTSTWVWVMLGTLAGVVVLSLIGGLFVLLAVVGDSSGDDYYVDDADLAGLVRQPCGDLEDAVDGLRLLGPDASGAADLRTVAAAARAVADAVEQIEGRDAELLAADWTRLAGAVDDYATTLTSPDARLDLPQIGGAYVSDRIYFGNDECYVPLRLEMLDPDAADDLYGV